MKDFSYFIIIFILIFIFILGGRYYYEKFQPYQNNFLKGLEKKCYSNPLTSAKCYITKSWPCPKDNGSYKQCTNNFRRVVNIADCSERSYHYSPKDERLSEKCIYKKINPFTTCNTKYNPNNPSIFPRVNYWRNDLIDNNFFLNF